MPKSDFRERLPTVIECFSDFVESHGVLTVCIFSVIYWIVTCALGASKLLWYDELWTYYPAKLKTAVDTWNFFMRGNDLHTPLASLAVRAATALFGNNELGIRIPVIAAYWFMCVCIYAFVSRCCSRVFAAAAMMFPLIASTYYYATEARPYGIVLGFSAAAILCWQRASSCQQRMPWWILALWLSLTLAVCAHFLALFLAIGLFFGEAVKTIRNKRLDTPVVAALILGVAPILFFVPAALRARQIYAGSFWSRPGLMDVANTYRDLINLAFFALLAGLILWAIASLYTKKQKQALEMRLPRHEVFAVSTLALLPVYTLPVFFVLGSFVPRYLLYTIVGLTISLAMLAYRSSKGDRLLGGALLLVFSGWFLFKAPSAIHANISERGGHFLGPAQPYENTLWMAQIERSNLPVVLTPAVFYLQFQHYAPLHVKERAYYLLSKEDSLRYTGTSTGEINLALLSRVIPIKAVDYGKFLPANPHFLVCAEMTNPTWVVQKLVDEGISLRLLVRQDSHFLFDVQTATEPSR
ncbi:MAG TPA: glycosyltransferase family 39 protein [Bryobacteraceae bacterium]|nr:glycosyltransferase family 39 protein [Bryobacteraceae bacterium]